MTSALKRARATLRRRLDDQRGAPAAPAPGSAAEQALVAKLVRAYDSGHVITLAGDRVRAITHFDTGALAPFGLPRSLPGR